MARLRFLPIVAASLFGAMIADGPALGQSSPPPPAPNPTANKGPDTDMGCRRQAAAQTGYSGANSATGSDDAAHRYADAYYACMDKAYGPPGPPTGEAYGPPPPPYYYPPYPYPYPYPYYGPYYYPPYYGPGVVFGFGFHRR